MAEVGGNPRNFGIRAPLDATGADFYPRGNRMGKKYLITGGAGFIGSHLGEQLFRGGHTVTALDDLSTGRKENLKKLLAEPAFRFVQGSVEDDALVARLTGEADAVFHLAAAVGVQLVVDEPVRTIHTTIHGTEVVLEAAHQHKRPVLITSSSEVYGKGSRVPFSRACSRRTWVP